MREFHIVCFALKKEEEKINFKFRQINKNLLFGAMNIPSFFTDIEIELGWCGGVQLFDPMNSFFGWKSNLHYC